RSRRGGRLFFGIQPANDRYADRSRRLTRRNLPQFVLDRDAVAFLVADDHDLARAVAALVRAPVDGRTIRRRLAPPVPETEPLLGRPLFDGRNADLHVFQWRSALAQARRVARAEAPPREPAALPREGIRRQMRRARTRRPQLLPVDRGPLDP